MSEGIHAAIDLGATSGRIMLGSDDFPLTEIYRFKTPVLHLEAGIFVEFYQRMSSMGTSKGSSGPL